MRPKRVKEPLVPPPGTVSPSDRDVLIGAYKSGLIVGWKRDNDQGYRLTLGGRPDAYVEVDKLTSYLAGLRKTAS